MDISVIFATYRRPRELEKTLESYLSLRADKLSWELVLVDNAGDPETETVVNRIRNRLPIRFLVVTRRGKNNALNQAISEAQGKLFLFTDDDVLVEPDWLVEMWEGSNRWAGQHMFGGKIIPKYSDGRKPPFDHPFLRGAFGIADWDFPEGIYQAEMVWGGNMAIRGDLFREGWKFNPAIGPDGSRLYVPGSEVDLTKRLEKAGYQAVYLPRSVVHHQIRDEQLELEWLYDRAFRFGQKMSYDENTANQESGTTLTFTFGIPHPLIARWCKDSILYVLSCFSKDRFKRFDRRVKLCKTKGRIFWYRKARS
jgi:glycosyltransferase involved in cell wall biosynthesis